MDARLIIVKTGVCKNECTFRLPYICLCSSKSRQSHITDHASVISYGNSYLKIKNGRFEDISIRTLVNVFSAKCVFGCDNCLFIATSITIYVLR